MGKGWMGAGRRGPGRIAGAALLAVVMLGAAGTAQGQILNTLRGAGSEEPGVSGEIGAFFSASGGNTEKTELTGAARVQWKGERDELRLLGDATRSSSGGVTTEEASVLHLRHHHRLAASLASVAFVQHQHDRFQELSSRFLVGAGGRWDWIRRDRLRGSWGVTPMLEVESLRGGSSKASGRLSTFLSLLGAIDDRTTVDLTAFLQPRFDDVDDLRATAAASLRVAVSGRWTVSVQSSLTHDARPAPGVERTDWKTRTGLSVSL